jgi:transketolase
MSKENKVKTARFSTSELEMIHRTANTIRVLAIDAIQKANSGHPGLPLGMADIAVVLWKYHLKHNPADPKWPDRDRFVLSGGHGSMLLYGLLHLTGYDLPMEELQAFRQWGSKTPGHPEHGLTPGVETTTGPLGQGITNAVGMAMAERSLASRFNRPDNSIIDHYTYVIASDGDLMEGVSHESCALAAHLGLAKLIVLYDDNQISIDGPTELTFSEDVLARFAAYNWHTQKIDGYDLNAINEAIINARRNTSQPSIIACKTVIGFGSPNRAGTSKAHGEPLGEEEVRLTKKQLGFPEDKFFDVTQDVKKFMGDAIENGTGRQGKWKKQLSTYRAKFPKLADSLADVLDRKLPANWEKKLPQFTNGKPMATRVASGSVINAVSPLIAQLIGGSADLTPSNNTRPANEMHVTRDDFSGRYIHFGVREHGMGGIINGMALHGGIIPYGGTFLVFSDYMRGSIRLAALMEQQVIYIFTHDSVGLGEDGPTHQPVEQIASLRAIPNLYVVRPADATETAQAWRLALNRTNGPTALILSRQKLPVLDKNAGQNKGVIRGAYAIIKHESPHILLLASGSEVHIVLEAAQILADQDIMAQVVSMPCWESFEEQSDAYKESILPTAVKARVALEAGVHQGWHQYVGEYGEILAINRFGASAPYQSIYENLGLTSQSVCIAAIRVINRVE